MKKIFYFVVASMFVVLSSCSKDNSSDENKFQYVQIKVTSDENKAPEAIVALFYEYSGNGSYTNITSFYDKGDNYYVTANNSSGKDVFPISGQYGENMLKSNDYSVHAFYYDNLKYSGIYGTPISGGKYTIYVRLTEGNNESTYKTFTLTKNSVITVHIPKSNKFGENVESTWKVE